MIDKKSYSSALPMLALLVFVGIVACSKEVPDQKDIPSPAPDPIPERTSDTLFFKGSVPGKKSTIASKSIMDESGTMTWEPSDIVKFFDGVTTVTASPENISGSSADFTVVGLNPKAERFYAAYPASMVESFEANGDIVFKSYGTEAQTRGNSYCAVAACPNAKTMTMLFRNVSYIFRISRPSSGAGSDARTVTFLTKDLLPVSSGITVTLGEGSTPEIANVQKGSNTTYTATAQFDESGMAIINIDPLVAENGYSFVAKDENGVAQGLQLIPKQEGKKKTFRSGYFLPFQLALTEEPERPVPVPTIDGLTFAQGNLYYDNGNWGIEDRQYDFRTWVGKPCCIDGVYSEAAGGTEEFNNIGLFYWTPDPDKSRAKSFDADWTTTAQSDDDFFANKIFSDWRSLTKAEFEHIATGRTNADALRARCTIIIQTDPLLTITGAILLPDNFGSNPGYELGADGKWTLPFGITLETARSKPIGTFLDNVLTKAQWSMFECSGVVFLPAAGKTGAEHVYIKESLKSLYYWSSYYYNYMGSEHRAFFAEGHNIIPGGGSYGNCAQGFAVRLVSSGK